MSNRQSAYLEAMGIDQWVLRSAAPVAGAEIAAEESKQADPIGVVEAAVEEPPAFSFTPAALPGFSPQQKGRILIICAEPDVEEGAGSAFEGEVAGLLDKMLGATHWPQEQCVLLSSTQDVEQVIAHTGAGLIIALGNQASQALLNESVEKTRQTAYPHPSGATVFASYHPVQAHGNPDQYKRPIWEDLKLAMATKAAQ